MAPKMFRLSSKDFIKGLVMAVLGGIMLPVSAAIQTPGFNILTVDWHSVFVLAVNGAIIGFVSYIVKNFFSDESGKMFGKIG